MAGCLKMRVLSIGQKREVDYENAGGIRESTKKCK